MPCNWGWFILSRCVLGQEHGSGCCRDEPDTQATVSYYRCVTKPNLSTGTQKCPDSQMRCTNISLQRKLTGVICSFLSYWWVGAIIFPLSQHPRMNTIQNRECHFLNPRLQYCLLGWIILQCIHIPSPRYTPACFLTCQQRELLSWLHSLPWATDVGWAECIILAIYHLWLVPKAPFVDCKTIFKKRMGVENPMPYWRSWSEYEILWDPIGQESRSLALF